MESLTKENFWDEMEQKYPKAMAHFKAWVDQYKSEHDWEGLFGHQLRGARGQQVIRTPKYHELPVAMQFGIFTEWLYSITNNHISFTIEVITGGINPEFKSSLYEWCIYHIPRFLVFQEARL